MIICDSGIAQSAIFGKVGSVDAIGTPERKSGTMGRGRHEQVVRPASRLPGVATHEEEPHSKHLPPRLELID